MGEIIILKGETKMAIIPDGVKVYFGERLKKRTNIENIIRGIFEKYSYNLIELPIYEYYQDIEDTFSESMKTKMFRMVDRDTGKMIALRPDMTSLLAKLVKIKKDEMNHPERLYYMGKVFRYEKIKAGRYREIKQAGIELIGEEKNKADIEVVVMALEIMKALGIKNPKIEIGDVTIFNAIFEKLGMTKDEIWEIKEIINRKDIPELIEIVKDKKYNDILLKLPLLIGGKEILDEVEIIYRELGVESEVEELRVLLSALDEKGYSSNYILDMGILKEMDYYTGIVFNGMGEGFGDHILSGGRYDKLMEIKAVGFALNVDALGEILK